MDIFKWEVSVHAVGSGVLIEGVKGCTCFLLPFASKGGYVYLPCFIERIFKITFEQKIQKIKKRCQRWCDKENAKEDAAQKAVDLSR